MVAPRRIAVLFLLPLLAAAGAVADEASGPGALAGRVTSGTAPLASAAVYAYQLADLKLWKGKTDEQGRFLFESLPAGLYKIIAAKSGFLPTIVQLTRNSAGRRQWVDVQLIEERPGAPAAAGFWSVREQVPPDVLRQIELASGTPLAVAEPSSELQLKARLQALTGVDERLAEGSAQLTGGRVDLIGEIRDIRLGLEGDFSQLQPVGFAGSFGGSTQEVVFNLEGRGDARLQVSSVNNRLNTGGTSPERVGLESHRVSWEQPLGEGHSTFEAQYTAENNFYGFGAWSPLPLPAASRSWRFEGSYATPLGQRTSLETGFRYRERESQQIGENGVLLPREEMELFGRGGLKIRPGVLLEYGLYSTLRDGSVWLTPHSGVVLQIGPTWQAGTSISSRIRTESEEDYPLANDFTPAYFGDGEACQLGEELCYRVFVGRADGKLSIGASHRQFAETLRLYFDRDFYNFFESIYLVDGDALPELTFEMERQLAPGILTRLESNLAAGGGGLLVDGGKVPYENDVRYIVTSLDTRFERTSTGVFLSFHHLAQELNPTEQPAVGRDEGQSLERLQVAITQELDILHRIASDLALQLNMEVSRGSLPSGRQYDDPDELRRRVTGGVAVKF